MLISEFGVQGLNAIFTWFMIIIYGTQLILTVHINVYICIYVYKHTHVTLYKRWQCVLVNTFLGLNLECQQYSWVANLILAKITSEDMQIFNVIYSCFMGSNPHTCSHYTFCWERDSFIFKLKIWIATLRTQGSCQPMTVLPESNLPAGVGITTAENKEN